MNINEFLTRFDKVKRVRDGQYVACCPAHDDKSPSLAIAETSDGRILVNCLSGCSGLDVISAVGVEWPDLFPDTVKNYRSLVSFIGAKPRQSVDDFVVEIAESDKKQRKQFSNEDKKRYAEALKRGGQQNGHIESIERELGIFDESPTNADSEQLKKPISGHGLDNKIQQNGAQTPYTALPSQRLASISTEDEFNAVKTEFNWYLNEIYQGLK